MIEFSVACDLDKQGGMINSVEKFGAGNYLAWNWATKTAIAGNIDNNLSGVDTSSFEKTNMLILGFIAAALEKNSALRYIPTTTYGRSKKIKLLK